MVAELTFCIKRKKKNWWGIWSRLPCRAGIWSNQSSTVQMPGEGWKVGGAFAHNFCLAGQEVVGCCSKLIEAQHECCIKYIFYWWQAHENFHAQPLPSFTPPPLPSSSKLITEPVPFDLSTENRGAVKAEKWGQQVRSMLWELRQTSLNWSTVL